MQLKQKVQRGGEKIVLDMTETVSVLIHHIRNLFSAQKKGCQPMIYIYKVYKKYFIFKFQNNMSSRQLDKQQSHVFERK